MRSVHKVFLATGSLSLMLAAACSDSLTEPASLAATRAVGRVSVIEASPTVPAAVGIGDTVYVSTAVDRGRTEWVVRNERVATLLSDGVVLATGEGETYVVIEATKGVLMAERDSTLIVVNAAPVAPPAPTDSTVAEPTPPPPPADTAPTPTTPPDTASIPAPATSGSGLWISASEIATLPTSGSAWSNVKSAADQSCGTPDLTDQNQNNNVCIMAKALVFARTGQSSYRSDVVSAIRSVVQSGTYNGRALALGRELAAYVISADLVGLKSYDASLDGQFRSKLAELRTTATNSGPSSLVNCHEKRPNNWGTMCGGSRIAIAAYLGDRAELDRAAQVFRGWLGDRSAYTGFSFGDLSWQCDASRPVGINPRGCTKDGHSLDGVLPDDERRGGSYSWPAPREGYVYEALQGALTEAVLLSRQGYDVWNWSDRALLRAYSWLHQQASFPASGDDTWQPHVINRVYGTSFPAPVPSNAGKIVGWTDWTHGSR